MDNPLDQFTGDTQIAKLLAELEVNFPPVNPGPKDDISTIMYRSGQRSLVDFIKHSLDK